MFRVANYVPALNLPGKALFYSMPIEAYADDAPPKLNIENTFYLQPTLLKQTADCVFRPMTDRIPA